LIDGVKTFVKSPIVPNPVMPVDDSRAVSLGEVKDLLNEQPVLAGAQTLFMGPWGSYSIFGTGIVNTTVETDLTPAAQTVPALIAGSTMRAIIAGDMRNQSAGAATLTLRVYTGTTLLVSTAITFPSDTLQRHWKGEFDLIHLGSGYSFVSLSAVFDPGNTDSLKSVVESALVSGGGNAGALKMTAQWSVAAANIEVRKFLATMMYGVAP
jgi:hypothetical protein